jgi:hypothetical protein
LFGQFEYDMRSGANGLQAEQFFDLGVHDGMVIMRWDEELGKRGRNDYLVHGSHVPVQGCWRV